MCEVARGQGRDEKSTSRVRGGIRLPSLQRRRDSDGQLALYIVLPAGKAAYEAGIQQCLQLPGFVRVFPEIWFGKRTTDIDRMITEIDHYKGEATELE